MAKVINRTKGATPFTIAIADALASEFEAFCESRGETKRKVIEQALRRHFDNPPPLVPLPSLPPVSGGQPEISKPKKKPS